MVDNGNGTYTTEKRSHYFGNIPSRGNSIKFPVNIFMEGEEVALFMVGKLMEFSNRRSNV